MFNWHLSTYSDTWYEGIILLFISIGLEWQWLWWSRADEGSSWPSQANCTGVEEFECGTHIIGSPPLSLPSIYVLWSMCIRGGGAGWRVWPWMMSLVCDNPKSQFILAVLEVFLLNFDFSVWWCKTPFIVRIHILYIDTPIVHVYMDVVEQVLLVQRNRSICWFL